MKSPKKSDLIRFADWVKQRINNPSVAIITSLKILGSLKRFNQTKFPFSSVSKTKPRYVSPP